MPEQSLPARLREWVNSIPLGIAIATDGWPKSLEYFDHDFRENLEDFAACFRPGNRQRVEAKWKRILGLVEAMREACTAPGLWTKKGKADSLSRAEDAIRAVRRDVLGFAGFLETTRAADTPDAYSGAGPTGGPMGEHSSATMPDRMRAVAMEVHRLTRDAENLARFRKMVETWAREAPTGSERWEELRAKATEHYKSVAELPMDHPWRTPDAPPKKGWTWANLFLRPPTVPRELTVEGWAPPELAKVTKESGYARFFLSEPDSIGRPSAAAPLSLPEKYARLSAIHDELLPSIDPIYPLGGGDWGEPRHDREGQRKGMWFAGLRAMVEDVPSSRLPEVQAILADVKADLAANVPALRPDDLIAMAVALADYVVSAKTIRRAVQEGKLHDYRPTGGPENAALILSREEVASRWPPKK